MSQQRGGKKLVRLLLGLGVCAVAAMSLIGCTEEKNGDGGGDTTAVVAMSESIESQQPGSLLDPAQFYGGEGLAITTAAYEGLVRYARSASSEIEPALATDWAISEDGLEYAFTLRDGVSFADGAPVNSRSVADSFLRFKRMDGGPSYMLESVKELDTSNPRRIVITLREPVSAFLDYLASPYGPKAISPAALSEHQTEGKQASDWLATNTAGTGPFQVVEYVPNERYVLERNEAYWGPRPPLDRLEYVVVADPAARILQLRTGDIDLARLDQPSTIRELSEEESLQVIRSSALMRQSVFLNQDRAPFDDATVRQSVWTELAAQGLAAPWGELAKDAVGMFPVAMDVEEPALPNQNAAAESGAVPSEEARSGTIQVVFNQGANQDRVVAESVGRVLESMGFAVELRAPGPGETWFEPVAPHIFVNTSNPDAAHPDTWARLFYHTDGFLNFLGVGNRDVDEDIDAGLRSTNDEDAAASYFEAMAKLGNTRSVLPVADVYSTFVANAGLRDWGVDVAAPFSLDLTNASLAERE